MRDVKREERSIESQRVSGAWIRNLAMPRVLILCVTLYSVVSLGIARWIVLPTLTALRHHRDKSEMSAKLGVKRHELVQELRGYRAELDLYVKGTGAEIDSTFNGAEANATFNYINALASEVGAEVRSFEQVVQGSERESLGGFTRAKVETNFLQMAVLSRKLSENRDPLVIQDFLFSSPGPNSDRLSISLTLSLISPRSPDRERCNVELAQSLPQSRVDGKPFYSQGDAG